MKRISVCCFVLVFLAVLASAYMVHEEPEEETDESNRGKRQQNDIAVIANVFNIPITTIKQQASAEQILSLSNIGKEDVSKIPVTTLKVTTKLINNKEEIVSQKATSSLTKTTESPQQRRQYDKVIPSGSDVELRHRTEIEKRFEAQRQQQRIYEEELRRRRFERVLAHNKYMQDQIVEEDKRLHSQIYRDPFGFNALTKWVVGPGRIFNGHAGHGDGHIYQLFNKDKPLHLEKYGQRKNQPHKLRNQEISHSIPSKSALSLTNAGTTNSSKTIASTSILRPTHNYEVHEVIDEGINPFTWPNWFGIINAFADRSTQAYASDLINEKIDPSKAKVKFNKLSLLDNKAVQKDEDHFKSKYAQARKNYNVLEAELTGNEIDGDLGSNENRLTLIKRKEKILFPNN